MAEKRMFSKSVIDSDLFLDMPLSTQCLYFHLAMRADDDGFVNNVNRIQRMIGNSTDDLRILISKDFIIPFESGVIVIKHWKLHNCIQKDRYKPSKIQERELIQIATDGTYEVVSDCSNLNNPVYKLETSCIQDGNTDKINIDKINIDKNNIDKYICSTDKQSNNNVDFEFEQIWAIYPRKQGKKKALEAFKRSLKRGASFEEIKNGVARYLEHIRVTLTPIQYIKMGSTYFTQESWNDEYGTVSNAPTSEDYDREASITDELDISKL